MLTSRNSWRLLAILLLPMPFLLLKSLGPGDAIWEAHLWDLGHIPLFIGWTAASLRMLPLPLSPGYIALRCGVLLAIGIAIEFIQRETGRSFDLWDVYRDGCGIAIAVRVMQFNWRRLYLADALLVLLVVVGIEAAVEQLFDRAYMSWKYPQIWQAAQPNAALRIGGSAHHQLVVHGGEQLLEVTHGTEQYSGVELLSMIGDWRGFETLQIEVQNPAAQPLDLACRVHDEMHYRNGAAKDDRFNRHFELHAGWNTLSIPVAEIESAPKTRRMQLDAIENLACFTVALPKPRTLYYREIRLLK